MSNFSNLRPKPQIPGQPLLPGQQPAPTSPDDALQPPQLAQNPTDPNLPVQPGAFGGNLQPDLGRTGGGVHPPGAPGQQQQQHFQPQPPVRGSFNDVRPDMGGGFPLAGGRPVGPSGGAGSGLDGSWVGPGSSLFHGRPGAHHGPGQPSPPAGVPPGARFDPIGPLGGRPLGVGGAGSPPLPRGGAAPLFRGEPDNDLERPPPDDDFAYNQRPDVRAANALMYGVPAVTGGTTGALAGGRLANPAAPQGQQQPPHGLPQPRQQGSAPDGAGPSGFNYGWN